MMTRRQRQKNMRRLAVGSAIAGAVGYLAGLLTAPQSGKETRQDIKEGANKAQGEAEKELKKLQAELDKTIEQAKAGGDKLRGRAKDELNDLTIKASDSREKAREMLSAVHEGEAEDKDLERAVKEANKALTHLRKYLKK